MAKDVNIHIKTPGAEKAEKNLNQVGQAARGVGSQTEVAGKKGGQGLEKVTKGAEGSKTALKDLKDSIKNWFTGAIGFGALIASAQQLIEKLKKVRELQREIYEQSLENANIGQALEFQTGTEGKQQFWIQEALKVREAGGLKQGVAQQMLTSMDIAMGEQGGIKNAEVRKLARDLAPFAGAAGMGATEISKLFEFAGAAGVQPTTEAYKKYFSQVQAGYTSSKATDFGKFMEALQQGGTAYIAQGGTMTGAISTFAGARSIKANEALAGTAMEQMSRLSSGAYKRPRQAMEQALGVDWSSLSMDQRMQALMQYAQRLPENQRTSILTEAGFPAELTSVIGTMVSPEAQRTIAATRSRVLAATPGSMQGLTAAYTRSMLGQHRQKQAGRELIISKEGPAYAAWQERLKTAQTEFETQVAKGEDRWIPDYAEPTIIALESLIADYENFIEAAPAEEKAQAIKTKKQLQEAVATMRAVPTVPYYSGQMHETGYQYSKALSSLGRAVQVNDYSQHYNPVAGPPEQRKIGPRIQPGVQQ